MADPVVSAIFASLEASGLAAEGLIRAILEGSGDKSYPRIGRLTRVTPQGHHGKPDERGVRIDVEVETDTGERLLIEFQMEADRTMLQRNLFSAARILTEASVPGDTHAESAARMPRIIAVNILNFVIRKDNTDVIQPIKSIFIKKPQRLALDHLSMYSAQLPMLDGMRRSFSKPWYCWLYALYESRKRKMDLREVIGMTPELQKFEKRDEGFAQYVKQYGKAGADPALVHEYMLWYEDYLRRNGAIMTAAEDGREQGLEEGLKQGREEGREEGKAERDALSAAIAAKDEELAALRAKLNDLGLS